MRALWLEDRRLDVRQVPPPLPDPAERECVVRVLLAGVCNTDLELARGYYPFTGIPGHEFVGLVEDGPESLRGQRVVGEINAVCHACPHCRAGRSNHCARRSVLGIVGRNGAFAERLALPAENLHRVPDGIPDEAAVFAEPLAAALRIGEQVALQPGERALVLGDGKLGLLVAATLTLAGAAVTISGRHPAKLAFASALGADALPPGAALPDGAFDLAVECTGSPEGFLAARRALRPAGTLVLKSTYAGPLTLDAAPLVVDEIRVVGSRCGPFRPALQILSEGRVPVERLISARLPLSRALEAFEDAARPGVLKVLVDPSA